MKIVYPIVVYCALLCSMAYEAKGQVSTTLRQKKIKVQAGSVVLDSLLIVPGSFTMPGIDNLVYEIDETLRTLRWKKMPDSDSVLITYRVFPATLSQPYSRFRYDSIANRFRVGAAPVSRTAGTDNRLVNFGNFSYTGSIGRSLSFGNAQDAVVNSLFNLQINGMLADSIQLAAAITDNNIPIQPDGTTQQLNEFDQVWLRFNKRHWSLNLGDIDVRQNPTYFLSYFKRQQGIAFETLYKPGRNVHGKFFVSGAIAKGKFTRNIFSGLEGNQGPYRLTGANNELFFVVLAGTERVFIDGVQMQRGEDQDYVINYNSAEITFTPRQLIQKDKRIQVEFEYADRNYLNALFYTGTTLQAGKKWQFNLAFYSNSDAKNSPINQTLNQDQRQFLSELGDSVQNAFYPVAIRDSFDANKVLYIKIDTLVNGDSFTIYRYQPEPDTALYSLSFSEVGANLGNYIPLLNGANGRVYQWVAPINQVPQGNFEPVAFLVTPKKQQMITGAIEHRFTDETVARLELAMSVVDANTLSSRDDQNNLGPAFKLQVKDRRNLKKGKAIMAIATEARYEWIDENYRPLERLRTIEFLRDWGLPFQTGFAQEQLGGATLKLEDSHGGGLSYDFTSYTRKGEYDGQRHTVAHSYANGGFRMQDAFLLTQYKSQWIKGYFLRPSVFASYRVQQFHNVELSASYALEHNEAKASDADTLLASSFSFRDWRAAIKTDPSKRNRASVEWFQIANQLVSAAGFVPLDVNNNLSLRLDLLQNLKNQVSLTMGYRSLQVKNSGNTGLQSDETFLGRGEYLFQWAKGALQGNILYELGAGQEQQRDFSYVEVPAGRGEFTWIDYNADGTPQLNEFEVAQFPDQAKYIRLFTPTNRFIKAVYNTLNGSMVFASPASWRKDASAWRRMLSRFNGQLSVQITAKSTDDEGFRINLVPSPADDTTLILFSSNIANTFSYNRFSTKWGADFTRVRNIAKGIQTYGFETRETNSYNLRIRKNWGRYITTTATGTSGTNELVTPNPKFDNRNYNIRLYSLSPAFIYTRGATFRALVNYKWDLREGVSGGTDQRSIANAVQVESKLNFVQTAVITGKFTFSNISFQGTPNSTVSYIMLDALQPGNNLIWTFDFTKRFANALELTFQYEGRKPGDTRIIHLGRAGIRAVL